MEETSWNLHHASTLPCLAVCELLWDSTPVLIHGPDGRNFPEPSQYKHLAVTECELLWNSTPTFIHRPHGRSFLEHSQCKHLAVTGTSELLWDSTPKFSIAPMEETSWNPHHASTLPFQGGGVYIGGGTVTIESSSIYFNSAHYVSTCLLTFPGTFFHGPDGRNFQETSQCKHITLFGRM